VGVPAVAVPIAALVASTFKVPVVITGVSFRCDVVLGECSSLVGVVASEIRHFDRVASHVFGPGTTAKVLSCTLEVCLECLALRSVPILELFFRASG
jgi:hypothetical protein